nr:MetaGeneMark_Unknown Function [uncultured bacterium]
MVTFTVDNSPNDIPRITCDMRKLIEFI